MPAPRHTPHPREYTDTDPKAMEVWLDLLRKMTPEERFTRGLQLCDLAAAVSEAGVRAAYPHADEREVFLRTAARRLPRECMIQAYGWDPQQHGHAR
jgi:hypothetical protein